MQNSPNKFEKAIFSTNFENLFRKKIKFLVQYCKTLQNNFEFPNSSKSSKIRKCQKTQYFKKFENNFEVDSAKFQQFRKTFFFSKILIDCCKTLRKIDFWHRLLRFFSKFRKTCFFRIFVNWWFLLGWFMRKSPKINFEKNGVSNLGKFFSSNFRN